MLAAARQAGLGTNLMLAPGQALAVYDLGTGTFDVAVVSGLVVLAESGLPDLGGLDVDPGVAGARRPAGVAS